MDCNQPSLSATKIKVLLVVRWPVGGIRTFLRYVISSFPEGKCDFHVIGIDTEGMQDLQGELGSLVKSWELLAAGRKETQSLAFSVFKFLRTNKIDVVHAHGFSSVIVSAIPAKLFRKPLILTSHDVLNSNQFEGIQGRLKRAALGFALTQCKVVHSVSDDAQANLLSFFPSTQSRCLVIKNGIDTNRFRSAIPLDVRGMAGLSDDTILIGFFGRFMGQKGFRFLMEAIRILRDEVTDRKFHVVCFGSGAFIREEKAEIVRKNLGTNFTFIPFIADASGAMKGCDLISMPSMWEACPLQPMEALSAGVPFVGSDCIGLREVLLGTPAVVVRTADPLSLAKGILQCSRIERSIFEKFAEVAAERFNVKYTSMSISSMYERAL